jgi:phosphonate transport system ATP-binding protein
VAIARALMQQPKVMLADEPIASLDPLNAKIVMDALRDINEKDGITAIANLHTLDTARQYCDRIIGMAAGKIVFDGAPDGLTSEAVQSIYGTETPIGKAADTFTACFGRCLTRADVIAARVTGKLTIMLQTG